jgi:hypothetical protein
MTDGDGSHWLARYVRTNLRFLAFQNAPIAAEDRGRFIKAALVCTWIAGIGRYWDHPEAFWWQYAGLGSVAYVFVLAALLWLVGLPLAPRSWSYRNVLLFVAMTSPLAWLYAVPVERFMELQSAARANVWFLAVVAVWRVALLLRHVAITSALGWFTGVVAALLPLSGVVFALAILNLEHATFDLMSSTFVHATTSNDMAYEIVTNLAILSTLAFPILLVTYVVAIVIRRRANRRQRRIGTNESETRS